MATVLAYVDAVPGRLYPLVPTLLELQRRGHRVAVRCGIDDVERLQATGLAAESLAPEIQRFAPDDWKARTPITALIRGLGQFGERARYQIPDLRHAIEVEHPDVLFIDEGAWGAAAAAEASGLPWAYSIVSPVPLRSRDAPPFGLGFAPRHDRIGRIRDATVGRAGLFALERLIARHMNPLRAGLGLRPVRSIGDVYLAADAVLAYTAEPFEYPRSDWPAKVRLVGPGLWEPPADRPAWLDKLDRPLVLVTCSTLFQNDRQLAEIACAAFAGEPYDVVVTTADVDASALTPPPNVRIERFVPHTPVLERASCVVCHAGMGITQKALAHGVPVVAVPFGRDQPEVAQRVEVAHAGVRLPRRQLTPDRLRTAVRRAMGMRSGAERIGNAFKMAGGAAAAADAIVGLLDDGGVAMEVAAGRPATPRRRRGEGLGARVTRLGAAAAAGALATVTMDAAMVAASIVGGDAFTSDRLDPQVIGRWAAGLLRGQGRHEDITREAPAPAELVLGLATHYATGIVLTEAFLVMPGRPTLSRAVAYGILTSALPLLVLFPSLGYGPFGTRSGEAGRLIRVMLVGHVAFGAGIGIWTRRLARTPRR